MYELIAAICWDLEKLEEDISHRNHTKFKINTPEGCPNPDKIMFIKWNEKESYKEYCLDASIYGEIYK